MKSEFEKTIEIKASVSRIYRILSNSKKVKNSFLSSCLDDSILTDLELKITDYVPCSLIEYAAISRSKSIRMNIVFELKMIKHNLSKVHATCTSSHIDTYFPPTRSHVMCTFEEQYKQQKEKSTKKNYKYGTIAAIALVALFIPSGILASDFLTEESQKTSTLLSESEQALATAGLYNSIGEHSKAFEIYYDILQKNPDDVNFMIGLKLSLSEIQNYDSLLISYNSLIVVDPNYPDPVNPDKTILQVLFYPDGPDGPGILIPRTNTGNNSLDVPFDTITDNVISAIVYPVDSKYPAVLYSESLDVKPQIISVESLQSLDTQNHILVIPGQLTNPDAKFIPFHNKPPLEYQMGQDGPLVVYPYGISNTEDLPALIFPDRSFNPRIITMNPLSGKGIDFPADYTFDQSANIVSNILVSNSDKSTPYLDFIFENGIKDADILSQINPNMPVRIFPNGADSIPIEYPAGLGFSQSITFPSTITMNTDVSSEESQRNEE